MVHKCFPPFYRLPFYFVIFSPVLQKCFSLMQPSFLIFAFVSCTFEVISVKLCYDPCQKTFFLIRDFKTHLEEWFEALVLYMAWKGLKFYRDWLRFMEATKLTLFLFRSVKVAQSCLTLWNYMDYSLPCSSVHGLLQARILEWVTFPFSRGSSQPRDRTQVSLTAGRCFTGWATREALCFKTSCLSVWSTAPGRALLSGVSIAAAYSLSVR